MNVQQTIWASYREMLSLFKYIVAVRNNSLNKQINNKNEQKLHVKKFKEFAI